MLRFFEDVNPPPSPPSIHRGALNPPALPPRAFLPLPDPTKTKAIRLQAIASAERYRLLTLCKGSAGCGGGRVTQLWPQTQGEGSALAKQNTLPPTAPAAADPGAPQTSAHDTSRQGQAPRCPQAAVWRQLEPALRARVWTCTSTRTTHLLLHSRTLPDHPLTPPGGEASTGGLQLG